MSTERADHSGLILTLAIVVGGLLILGVLAAGVLFVGTASVAPMPMAVQTATTTFGYGAASGTMIQRSELQSVKFDQLAVGDALLLGPRVLRVQDIEGLAMTVEHLAQAEGVGGEAVMLELLETREILTYERQECDVQEMFRLPTSLEWFLTPELNSPATEPAPEIAPLAADSVALPAEQE